MATGNFSEYTDPVPESPPLVQGYDPTLPLERASTPPAAWYTEADIAALEQRRVFANSWQPAARLDQLESTGYCVTVAIAGQPIVVVKNEQGIKAFYNVCRHHGAEVVQDENPCLKRLHCPYHGWTYSLSGELVSTPAFEGAENFDRTRHGLIPVQCEIWENWVWVNLNPEADSLAHYFGSFYRALAQLNLGQLRFYQQRSYTLDCNWKVFVDNYLDGGYHVPLVHKGLGSVLDNKAYQTRTEDRYCLQHCPISGADNATGSVRKGDTAWYYWHYPNLMFNCYQGMMDTNWVIPINARQCQVICDFWFADVSRDAAEHNQRSIEIADEIQAEDIAICESVQRGLDSNAYDRGRLSPRKEKGEYWFHQLLYRDLLKPAPD